MSEPDPATNELPANQVTFKEAAVAIGLVLGVVILEIGLRFLGYHDPVLYERDFQAGYVLKPSQEVRIGGNRIAINQWSVRDPRSLDEKAADVRRIVVLGDSVTWGGVTVTQDDLFTSRLESLIGQTEVINAGVNGYSVYRMAAFYEHSLQPLDAGAIIMVVIPRDFTRPTLVEIVGDSTAFPTRKPAFAMGYLAHVLQIKLYERTQWEWAKPPPENTIVDVRSEAECVAGNLEALADFRDVVEDRPFVVVFAPTLPGAPSAEQLPALRDAVEAMGISVVDLNAIEEPDPAWFMDGVHLNGTGHARVGEMLAAWITESSFLKAPETGESAPDS